MERLQRWTRRMRTVAFASVGILALSALVWLARVVVVWQVTVWLVVVAAVAVLIHRALRRHLPGRIVLEIDLDQGVVEHAADSPMVALGDPKPVLRHVVEALDRAAGDGRVLAVIVRLGTSGMGLAQAQEVRDALARVRAARIRTIAVAETFGEAGNGTVDYHVACVCDEIVLQRVGDFGVIGFLARTPFLRGALDRLSIRPRFDHRREYKSAMYLLTEQDMPAPQREATQAVLEAAHDAVVEGMVRDRGIDRAEAVAAVDAGPLLPREAFARGLVDRLGFYDEVRSGLEEALGATSCDLETYRQRALRHGRAQTLALVYATGAIVRGSSREAPPFRGLSMGSDDLVGALTDAADSKRVRAVVLRVDSPGGSAVASEAVWRAVRRVQATGTPVVVSMGNVAGSGGYYIACGADRIVAQPGTITGSIGVVAGKLVTERAWHRIGVRWEELSAGDNAGIWSSQSDFSDAQWESFERHLDEVYTIFKERVADGRDLSPDAVEAVAKGRTWAGRDAVEAGLVDELGGLDRAIELARELAGIDPARPHRIRVMPERSRIPWRRLQRRSAAVVAGWRELSAPAGAAGAALEQLAPPGILWWDGRLR